MEKIYGILERNDQLIKFEKTGTSVLIWGYGEENMNEDIIKYQYKHTFYAPIPKEEMVKYVSDFINRLTAEKMLTGYQWEGINVYLSSENQFNFKVAHDMAVQSKGKTLPLTFKLGEDADGTPQYYTFESLSSIKEFYKGAVEFIQKTLADGWKEKDAVRNMIMNS